MGHVRPLPIGFPKRKWLKKLRERRFGKRIRTTPVPEWVWHMKRPAPPSKSYPKASFKWKHLIEEMVIFSRGEIPHKDLDGFFRLFLNKSRKSRMGIKTAQEVRELLQNAYWIEEEDVRQELAIILFSKIKFANRGMHRVMMTHMLSTGLRDYLESQLKFRRPFSCPQEFSYEEIDNKIDLLGVISTLPRRKQLLYYYHCIMDMDRIEVFPLLMYTSRNYNTELLELTKKIKGALDEDATEPE